MQVSGSAGSVARDSMMYEVFVSFTRTGHPELAFRTKDMLNDVHIPIFLDEGLPVAEGISDGIVAALREAGSWSWSIRRPTTSGGPVSGS